MWMPANEKNWKPLTENHWLLWLFAFFFKEDWSYAVKMLSEGPIYLSLVLKTVGFAMRLWSLDLMMMHQWCTNDDVLFEMKPLGTMGLLPWTHLWHFQLVSMESVESCLSLHHKEPFKHLHHQKATLEADKKGWKPTPLISRASQIPPLSAERDKHH